MNAWVKQMHIADWTPTSSSRICSKHFEKELFYKIGNKTCLLDDAVPTVFEEIPRYLQSKVKLYRNKLIEILILKQNTIKRHDNKNQRYFVSFFLYKVYI